MRTKKFIFLISLVLLLLLGCSSKEKNVGNEQSKKETVLYITRHGKTILNTLDRVQGWADTPLTSEGQNIAKQLGEGLKKEKIEFKSIHSSDLGRAQETANIILTSSGSSNTAIDTSRNLREANYGMYEGDLNSNMMSRILKENNMNSPEDLTSLGMGMWKISADTLSNIDELKIAESAEVITNRMASEISKIAKDTYNSGGGNVLIVGHGMSISLFLDSVDNSLDFNGHLPNASISKVVYDGENFKVMTVGDTSLINE